MLGQMGSFSRPSASESDPLDLYVHGYVSSRLMNLGRGSEGEGLPVSVCASHVDGLVLAMSSFNHSYNYRSALLFGHARLVEDDKEKLYAMELITNGVVPDRWGHTRLPIMKSELQSTSLLRISIVSGSAKVRDGNASDDRHDMENNELRAGMWTGTLPVYQQIGEPIPSAYSKVGVPEHVKGFVEEFNKESMEHAVKVAQVKKE